MKSLRVASSRATFCFLCALVLVLLAASRPGAAETNGEKGGENDDAVGTWLLQDPTVSAEHIVFVYAADLWIVPRAGGAARRLTSNPGRESAPQLSPDGRWVAFSGQYEGNTDVYVIAAEGGAPKRLTWHPGNDLVRDWHPDGERVLFSSGRSSGAPVPKLFTVSVAGGMPEQQVIPKAWHASYDESATHLAYTPIRDAFRSWKRHRGGTVPPVWIFDLESHDVEEIPHGVATDTFPCWLDGAVYFCSDRDMHMNLYRYRPGSGEVEQLTTFQDFDIRNIDAAAGVVVLEQAGQLHTYDPASGELKTLTIDVRSDGLAAMPRWTEAKGQVRSASIAPNGKRAVFEARGEIITVPREHGDARNLTQSAGSHDRSPTWSPDGKQIAWFSDDDGEYRLMVGDRRGREEVRSYDLGGGGFYYAPMWSPDGEKLLFRDKANRLAYLTLESGDVTDVALLEGSLGILSASAAWSPDSRWIAFENRNPRTMYDQICLFELATGEVTSVTDDFGATSSPAFSADGAHLFFFATIDSGPRLFGLDMSTSAARASDGNLYVAVLAADGEHPLAPKSDEGWEGSDEDEDEGKEEGDGEDSSGDEEPDGDGWSDEERTADAEDEDVQVAAATEEGDKSEDADEEGEDEDEPIQVDVDGIDQRVLALPIPSGNYRSLQCTDDKLLFVSFQQGGGSELKSFGFDDRKVETLASGVRGFEVSADRKWLLTSSSRGFEITNAKGKDGKKLDIDSVKLRVDPREEWPQIVREVWRIQRDYFYDPNMHGVDWPAMLERWTPFVDHVQHRADLNVVVSELIGELACGHQYVSGGDTPDAPDRVSVGLLGADWEVDASRYRLARIYRGQNWNPNLRAPLTEPGVDASEGDYLIEVNGREVTADDNLFEAFENTAGLQVDLVLASDPSGAERRAMTVVPIGSEGGLRRASWVEDNRRRVDELSGGRLAYIYMPNTSTAGMAAFDRDFYSQLDKEGVVLDERYNGGGKVANYVIEVLSRRVMSYWMNREQWVSQSPFATIEGPKVMVINESAGSGGDWMPWAFRNYGIGPLVGTRTWGGLVGISGYPPLMDGGSVTAASFGVMDRDGNWAVENEGVAPDYEVIEWPKEVIAGGDPQLEKAVELALEQLQGEARSLPTYSPPAAR